MVCKEDIIFIIHNHLLGKAIAVEVLEMNQGFILFLGDCRFVSATFRLFKLSKTGPTKRCKVIYNGGITGHEKELIFDVNFTFKVNKDFHDFQHSSYSYPCSRNLLKKNNFLMATPTFLGQGSNLSHNCGNIRSFNPLCWAGHFFFFFFFFFFLFFFCGPNL